MTYHFSKASDHDDPKKKKLQAWLKIITNKRWSRKLTSLFCISQVPLKDWRWRENRRLSSSSPDLWRSENWKRGPATRSSGGARSRKISSTTRSAATANAPSTHFVATPPSTPRFLVPLAVGVSQTVASLDNFTLWPAAAEKRRKPQKLNYWQGKKRLIVVHFSCALLHMYAWMFSLSWESATKELWWLLS